MLLQREMIASYYQIANISNTQPRDRHTKEHEEYSFAEILKKEILHNLSIVTPMERCRHLKGCLQKEYEVSLHTTERERNGQFSSV